MKKLAVIGGGASGLSAAVQARKENNKTSVVVFEKMQKAGKKLLATGNGRCNFTNRDLSPSHFYGEKNFLCSLLNSEYSSTEDFFLSLGVLPFVEDDRVYPRSQQASTIKEALLNALRNEGIEIITDSPVNEIRKENGKFKINGMCFDAVIIAGGGKASSVHGSDGSAIRLLESFGHKCSPLYPALCGLLTAEKGLNLLKGVRAECEASLYCKNELLGTENGEVQFTDTAVSGIPILNLSHLCENKKDLRLLFDLCPEFSKNELSAFLKTAAKTSPEASTEAILNGIVSLKLGYAVMNKAEIKPQKDIGALSPFEQNALVTLLKEFEIKIKGTKGFENAQATKGGIRTDGFFPETLMSRFCEGLFACGEVLDIHGDCGGYNLHLAWTSGRLAGAGAGKYLKTRN